MRHDSERIGGPLEIRRPETVGELMQFPQAATWIRISLSNTAEVSPVRALLERKLKGTTRTKKVASRKVISKDIEGRQVGRNLGGVAELPRVGGRRGAAQLSQAGLSRANVFGRK